MSDKVSELPALTGALTGSEPFIVNQGGVTRQGTLQDLIDAVNTGAMVFRGTADASQSTPVLATGAINPFVNGDMYQISTGQDAPHAFSSDGVPEDLEAGDFVVFNGTSWNYMNTNPLTAAEVKTLYESNSDTNAFTNADVTNLGNQSGTNTGDMSDADVKTAYENNANTNAFEDSDEIKLDALSEHYDPYAIDLGVANGNELDFTPSGGSGEIGFRFSPDGFTAWSVDASNDLLSRWTCPNKNSIQGASFVGSVSVLPSSLVGGNFGPQDFEWVDNGNKLWIMDSSQNNIWEYIVTTPYDETTITTLTGLTNFSLAAPFTSAFIDMRVVESQSKIYMTQLVTQTLQERNIGVLGDVTSISGIINSISLSAFGADFRGVAVHNEGDFIYFGTTTQDKIVEVAMPTPYSLAGATPTGKEFDVSGQTSDNQILEMRPDGRHFLIAGFTENKAFEIAIGDESTGITFTEKTDLSNLAALAFKATIQGTDIDTNTIPANKLFQINSKRILGRDSAGAGNIENLTAATIRTILNVEDDADANDPNQVTAPSGPTVLEEASQAAYDAGSMDADTMYLITS